MNTLGFRKNDYKNPTTDLSDSEGSDVESHETSVPFSDILAFHDELWYIWEELKLKVEEMGVPIFDEANFSHFLNFVMKDNPYLS